MSRQDDSPLHESTNETWGKTRPLDPAGNPYAWRYHCPAGCGDVYVYGWPVFNLVETDTTRTIVAHLLIHHPGAICGDGPTVCATPENCDLCPPQTRCDADFNRETADA